MARSLKTGLIVSGDASGATSSLNTTGKNVDALNKKTRSSQKTFAQYSKSVVSGFGSAAASAVKWGGVAGAAAAAVGAAMVKSGLSQIDTLAKTSDKLGVTTEALARLRFAAEQTGVQQSALDIGLQRFTRRLADAAAGTGPAVKAFEALGLSAEELIKLSPDQALGKVADKMTQVESQTSKVAIAFKLFDSEGVGLVNTLAGGSAGLAELGDQATAAGVAISRIDAAKVEAANDAVNRVKTGFAGLSQQLAVRFAPLIEDVANRMFGAGKEAGGMAIAADKAFRFVIKGAGLVADGVRGIQIAFYGIKAALEVVVLGVLRLWDTMISGLLKGWNWLAERIPGLDPVTTETLFAKVSAVIERQLAETTDKIKELANAPIPSTALENWADTATERFDTTATAVVASNGAIQESVITTEQVTAALATTTKKETESVESAWDKAMTNVVERIDSSFAEAWKGAFNSFSDFASGIKDALKNLMAELAHQMLTRPLVMNIGAALGLGGASGAASAASGIGSGAGLLKSILGGTSSLGGSLLSGITSVGGLFGQTGNMMASNFGQSLVSLGDSTLGMFGINGTSAGTSALAGAGLNFGAGLAGSYVGTEVGSSLFGKTANSSIGAGVGGTIGAVAGGPIGAFIGSTLGGMVDSLFGSSNAAKWATYDQDFGTGSRVYDSSTMKGREGSAQQARDILDIFQGVVDTVGGSNAALEVAVSHKQGLRLDGKKYKDAEEFFRVGFDKIISESTNLSDSIKNMALRFRGTADEAIAFTDMWMGIESALDTDVVQRAIDEFTSIQEGSTYTLLDAYRDQADAISGVVDAYDGSFESAQQLSQAMNAAQVSAYEMATAILALQDQINKAAANSAQQIRESVMTEEQRIKSWTAQRDQLRATLDEIVSPERLTQTTQEVLALNQRIFNSLGDEAQQNQAEAFATYAEETAEIASGRYDEALQEVRDTQEDIASKVGEILSSAAQKQETAATDMANAAAAFGGYVQGLIANGIPVNVAVNLESGSEVNA